MNKYLHVGSPVYFVIKGDYNYTSQEGMNKVSFICKVDYNILLLLVHNNTSSDQPVRILHDNCANYRYSIIYLKFY